MNQLKPARQIGRFITELSPCPNRACGRVGCQRVTIVYRCIYQSAAFDGEITLGKFTENRQGGCRFQVLDKARRPFTKFILERSEGFEGMLRLTAEDLFFVQLSFLSWLRTQKI